MSSKFFFTVFKVKFTASQALRFHNHEGTTNFEIRNSKSWYENSNSCPAMNYKKSWIALKINFQEISKKKNENCEGVV